MSARYVARGPHAGRRGESGRWTVVDTNADDVVVDVCRTRDDAREVARELNAVDDREAAQ